MASKNAAFVVIIGDMYYTDRPYFIGSSVPDFEIRARQVGGMGEGDEGTEGLGGGECEGEVN